MTRSRLHALTYVRTLRKTYLRTGSLDVARERASLVAEYVRLGLYVSRTAAPTPYPGGVRSGSRVPPPTQPAA